jgi:flagellin-like protein
MEIRKLLSDEQGVSPVIGVILMVAITVILAAVIATFVLGLGDQISTTAPQASFSFDYDGDDLTVTHDGGDTVDPANLYIRGSSEYSNDEDWNSIADTDVSDVKAGNSATLNVADGDTIRVIYQSSTGETSATLAEWSGPSA